MRRAFQTVSAALPRALSTPSNLFANRALRFNRVIRSAQPSIARSLHQSPLLRDDGNANIQADDADVQAPLTKFQDLQDQGVIHKNIVRNMTEGMGLETMTEVQAKTINAALKGTDIIAQARTGTGKTMAFLLPILQNILSEDPDLAKMVRGRGGPRSTADDIRALIVSPTRELAEQIAVEAKRLVAGTGVIVQTAVGGTQKSMGLRAIQREGCHILVGTPGRLKDILSDPYTKVEAPDLSALVFDEADRLLDQGFWPEIQEIMRLLPTPEEKNRQTLMFSATVPKEVISVVRGTLKPGFQFVKCVNDNEEPTHTRVPQMLVTTKGFENNLPALTELCAREIQKHNDDPTNVRPFKAIVYFGSTAEVSLATSSLHKLQTPEAENNSDAFGGREHPFGRRTRILEIHSKLTQGARTKAAENFRRADSAILLSSDVTARGMDFPNVTHVIQMGLPSSVEQYIHRIGRTARAGKEGEGWLILNKLEDQEARHRFGGKIPLKRDNTISGQEHAASARTVRPTAEAKEEAWRDAVERDDVANETQRSIAVSFQVPGQAELVAPFLDRYLAVAETIWEEKGVQRASTVLELMFPMPLISTETVARLDDWLETSTANPAAKRYVREGRADMVRALAGQERDAAR